MQDRGVGGMQARVQAGMYGGCRRGTGRSVWRVQTGYRQGCMEGTDGVQAGVQGRATGTGARCKAEQNNIFVQFHSRLKQSIVFFKYKTSKTVIIYTKSWFSYQNKIYTITQLHTKLNPNLASIIIIIK
jgi:hypothetical protein